MTRFWFTPQALLLLALIPYTANARADDKPAAKPRVALATFAELEKRLGDADLRILDARSKADYDKGHITGAVWVDVRAAEKLAGKPGGLVDKAAWEAWIAPLGISPKTETFVYDGRRQLEAARVWWLLSYLGVERVGLVDGNFPLWNQEKHPVTTDVPKIDPKPFHVEFQAEKHATRDDVLAAISAKSAVVVDARTEGEYSGKSKLARKGGHIPNACRLEWSNLVGTDGRFLAEPALRAKLSEAGIEDRAGSTAITHCQGGGRSSVDAFVLERLGFKTRNYYLGWSDWGNAENTPVEVDRSSKSK